MIKRVKLKWIEYTKYLMFIILNFVIYYKPTGNNGMHHAAMNGKIDVMRMLLLNSINLETVNEEGKTPLHYSCERGEKECIFLLVTNGMNSEVKSKAGQKAGDGNMDSKMLLNTIACEEKAFNVLSP